MLEKLSTKLTLSGRSGSQRKTIRIESNDPESPTLELALVGKASKDFEVSPPTLVLKTSPTQPASGSVRIKSTDGSTFEITKLHSASGKVKLRADPIPEENAYQVSAQLEEVPEAEQFQDTVTVSTSLKGGSQIELPLITIIPKQITVVPTKIVLNAAPGILISRAVILKAPKSEVIEVDRIQVPNPQMTQKVHALGNFGLRINFENINPTDELNNKKAVIYLKDGRVIEIVFEITVPLEKSE